MANYRTTLKLPPAAVRYKPWVRRPTAPRAFIREVCDVRHDRLRAGVYRRTGAEDGRAGADPRPAGEPAGREPAGGRRAAGPDAAGAPAGGVAGRADAVH